MSSRIFSIMKMYRKQTKNIEKEKKNKKQIYEVMKIIKKDYNINKSHRLQ